MGYEQATKLDEILAQTNPPLRQSTMTPGCFSFIPGDGPKVVSSTRHDKHM